MFSVGHIACAGIYSLLGFMVFALFLAYITNGSARKESGLIKRDIINREDEPFLVWKSQIPL